MVDGRYGSGSWILPSDMNVSRTHPRYHQNLFLAIIIISNRLIIIRKAWNELHYPVDVYLLHAVAAAAAAALIDLDMIVELKTLFNFCSNTPLLF